MGIMSRNIKTGEEGKRKRPPGKVLRTYKARTQDCHGVGLHSNAGAYCIPLAVESSSWTPIDFELPQITPEA